GDARVLQRPRGRAAVVGLPVDLVVAPDLDLEGLAQGVHHGYAHAVQAARDLVGLVVELAARVQLGEHDLRRVHAGHGRVGTAGDAAAVVDDGDRVVDVDGDVDLRAVSGQGLVHRIVDHLVDEMVEPGLARGP